MKLSDRVSSIAIKIESLKKTVQKISGERKITSRTVFLIFFIIFAASLLVSLVARIIITYFENFLIYLLSFLLPFFWLSWLGVIALIAYLISKNPEKTLKVIASVIIILFVYAIFPVISMEPHSALKITHVGLIFFIFLVLFILSAIFPDIGVFEAPAFVYFLILMFSLTLNLGSILKGQLKYTLVSSLLYQQSHWRCLPTGAEYPGRRPLQN